MKRIVFSLFTLVLIVPQVAFAAWWNPFSWKVFSWLPWINKPAVTYQTETSTTSTFEIATSTATTTQTKISETKQEEKSAPNIKPKVTTPTPNKTPLTQTPPTVIPVTSTATSTPATSTTVLIPATPTSSVSTPSQPQVAETPAITVTNSPLLISSVVVTATLNSAQVMWDTNLPAYSKIFISGGNLSSKVISSDSGLSTRHVVNIPNLTSGTPYSYEIESIAGNQVAKKQGSFSTNQDQYTLSVQPDKTSVQATGWNNINIRISPLKNGSYINGQSVSMTTPDASQNKTVTINSETFYFEYFPKTTGIHTLTFSWNGISQSIDVQGTEYIKVDPKIEQHFVYQENTPIEIPTYDDQCGCSMVIGRFSLIAGDEPIRYDIGTNITIESDIPLDTINRLYHIRDPYGGVYALVVSPRSQDGWGNSWEIPLGVPHYIKINKLGVSGMKSGLYREVQGLPLTFQFIIQ